MADPAHIAALLRALPVEVERAGVRVFEVPVQPYEGGARPSSEVVLEGRGAEGRGESVAWTLEAHRAGAERLEGFRFSGLLGAAPVSGTAYDRCALEGALIDLALRQNGLSWAAVTGAESVQLDTWVSFDRCADPAARAASIDPGARFKIDVHPAWQPATFEALAQFDVGVLDFKHAPGREICERARVWFPETLFEDPAVVNGPTARDQSVLQPLDAIVAAGERVNLKGPRMGGWFAVLEALRLCGERGIPVYFGGMFELGVGRDQARRMAAAFAPDAWHDLAAIPPVETGRRPPVIVDPTSVGFS